MSVVERILLCLASSLVFLLFKQIDFDPLDSIYDLDSLTIAFNDSRQENTGYVNKTYNFVLHTHNDPGWILTMEEYEKASVDSIIS